MLLDSHVLLWVLTDDPRIGPSARRSIAAAAAVHVSAITLLELTVKRMLGKLELPQDLAGLIASQGLRHQPWHAEDAQRIEGFLGLVRHDPFDRALLAQAHHRGWLFLTADERLLALGLDQVVDARS